jgi:hypothetical protein
MNGEFELRKKPVSSLVLCATGFGKIKPGHINAAVFVASNVEFRAVNIELLKTKPHQRARRQCGQDARQVQGFSTLRIKQLDIGELERGDHAGRVRRDGANAHRYLQHLGGLGLELRTKLTDSRHNQPMQRTPG